MSTEGEKMKGYKGFNQKLQCTPGGKVFQYEVGKEYVHDGDAELCLQGFHFCENPLDTLRYYQPATGRYAEVEAEGVTKAKAEDSKRVAKKLKIIAEVKLKSLIEIGVKFLLSKSENPTSGNSSPAATSGNSSHAATSGEYSHAATSGNSSHAATSGNSSHAATSGNSSHAATSGYSSHAATSGEYSPAATSGEYSPAATRGHSSHAATSGNYSHAATSGDYSHAATSGYSSHAATSGNSSPAATSGYSSPAATSGYSSHAATSGNSSPAATSGKESIAASIGYNAQARAALGSWIVLAEYKSGTREVLTVKTAKVDGKKIKADTFYQLKKGKFVVVGARRSSRWRVASRTWRKKWSDTSDVLIVISLWSRAVHVLNAESIPIPLAIKLIWNGKAGMAQARCGIHSAPDGRLRWPRSGWGRRTPND
jgi:hypothetical protein